MKGNSLAILGNQHLEVARTILNTDVLRQKLDNVALTILGMYHPKIAWHVFEMLELNNPSNQSGLTSEDLCTLSRRHPAMIKHILNTPHLRGLFSPDKLKHLCEEHLESLESVAPEEYRVRNCNALINLSRTLLQEIQKETGKNRKNAFGLN